MKKLEIKKETATSKIDTRWIEQDWLHGSNVTICPACRHEFATGALYAVGNLFEGLPRYCPNCGADMMKKEENGNV